MTEKKKYEAPQMEVAEVDAASIICTSGSNQVQTNDLIYDNDEYEF